MRSNHFALRIKRSCLRIYEELVCKEFILMTQKLYDSIEARSSVLWVFYAAEHVRRAAILKLCQESFLLRRANNLFQEKQNFLRGAKNLFRESQNCLRAAYNLFRESRDSLRGANNKLSWELFKPNKGSKINLLWETKACINETALRGSECNDIIKLTDCKTCLK